jgi:hypothetical protein
VLRRERAVYEPISIYRDGASDLAQKMDEAFVVGFYPQLTDLEMLSYVLQCTRISGMLKLRIVDTLLARRDTVDFAPLLADESIDDAALLAYKEDIAKGCFTKELKAKRSREFWFEVFMAA